MRQLIANIYNLNTENTQAYEPHMFSFSWEKLGKDYDFMRPKNISLRNLN